MPLAATQTQTIAPSLDWSVATNRLFTYAPNGHIREVQGFKALYRSDNDFHLGIVSDGYEVVQNSELYRLIQPLVAEGLLTVTNAGILRGGRKVFIQARMAQEFKIAGETHRGMLTLLNSHDGTTRLAVGVTDVRVICSNTYAMAYSQMGTRLAHTLGINERMLSITQTVDYVNQRMGTFQDAAETLSRAVATPRQVEWVMRAAFGKRDDDPFRQRDELMNLYRNGMGNEGRTLWDAFNAVTEYASHKSRRNEDARFRYANFGAGVDAARRALETALALA